MTPKQQAFCREYIVDLNATQAAVRAGYSPRTARQIASENLSKPDIQDEIALLMSKRSERTEMTADWVLDRLREIVDWSMLRGPIRDSSRLPEERNRFHGHIAVRALELIGRHLAMFKTVHIDEGQLDMEAVIRARDMEVLKDTLVARRNGAASSTGETQNSHAAKDAPAWYRERYGAQGSDDLEC